jgi:hypothetical protein
VKKNLTEEKKKEEKEEKEEEGKMAQFCKQLRFKKS